MLRVRIDVCSSDVLINYELVWLSMFQSSCSESLVKSQVVGVKTQFQNAAFKYQNAVKSRIGQSFPQSKLSRVFKLTCKSKRSRVFKLTCKSKCSNPKRSTSKRRNSKRKTSKRRTSKRRTSKRRNSKCKSSKRKNSKRRSLSYTKRQKRNTFSDTTKTQHELCQKQQNAGTKTQTFSPKNT